MNARLPQSSMAIDWDAVRADLHGLNLITAPSQRTQLSKDFYWYSPILTAQLADCVADLVVKVSTEDDVRLLTDLLNDVDGVERIEEIADLMPHMDDEDSSSAGLSDDIGPGTHELEVEVPHAAMLDKLRDIVEAASERYWLVLEIDDNDV